MIKQLISWHLRNTALMAGLAVLASSLPASAAKSITQFGITWTFDKDYPSGTFANGDFWVVGPVKITVSNRTMNGSMVNPTVTSVQGYDSLLYGNYNWAGSYDPNLNVASGVSDSDPLTLATGSSLVSTISVLDPVSTGKKSRLQLAAVLTVLGESPPANSFRPPYAGTDKAVSWKLTDLDYSKLPNLPKVNGAPDPAVVASWFSKLWLDHVPDWLNVYLHPKDSMPEYGRDIANYIGTGALSLMLDYTEEQKRPLLINLVQIGLDYHRVASLSTNVPGFVVWPDNGGCNHGHKLPILLAGLVLNEPSLLKIVNGSNYFIFQEDRQTFYVEQSDVGRILYTADGRPREMYIQADVGLPEWGERHAKTPSRDGRNWSSYYRRTVGHSILAHVLVARLLNAESIWNWPALFDYTDRYWTIEKDVTSGADRLIEFHKAMWNKYGTKALQQPATSKPMPPSALRITSN
ncbi:MAG: hypothetical protein ACYDC1_18320 [Limisphaerales bacterium]